MQKEEIEKEFKHEVMTHKDEYPMLYETERKKNNFRFQQEQRERWKR